MRKLFSSKTFQAFLLSFILGMIIILPNIIGGNGIYNLLADFNVQQIPFNKMIGESIKEGSILWTWYNELGSNFIGTFGFYNLFSPFNIIGYLFPSSWFEYLIGPIFMLKYAVAGLTSYLFFKRYVKNKNYAIIGSLLYSFSGFQLTNIMFYHFHDIVALFPLLLYTLDNLIYDNKKGRFALVVALLAFTNWFFFIGEVIFVIIYFIVKILTKEYKWNFKNFILVTFEGLIGTLISAIVLLPTYMFIISNPRVNSTWTSISLFKYWDIKVYLEILRSFIFPPELMYIRSFLTDGNYSSVEAYLPVVGIVLLSSYFFKKPKNWVNVLFIIICIFMIVPILNSSFFMFNSTYYARWFYMPSLIMCLMSIKCLEEQIKIKKGIIFNLLCYVLFGIAVLVYILHTKNSNVIIDSTYFILSIIISVVNIIIIFIITNIKTERKKIIFLILSIFIFVGLWGNYMTYKYKSNTLSVDQFYINYLDNNTKFSKYKNNRTNSSASCLFNMGYTKKLNNIKSFNSNINGSNFEFYNSIDYKRNVSTEIYVSDKDLNDYLSVKYIISCGSDDLEQYGYEYKESIDGYTIYYNKDFKEFGFAAANYMLDKKFEKLSSEEKKKKLKNTIVLNEEQIKKYQYLYDDNENTIYKSSDFEFKNNGFSSRINSSKETLAIYTIPYDNGWVAKVNGKEVDIEKVDNGMMAIKINKGENDITFNYITPGLKYGMILSVISSIILFLYVMNPKLRNFKWTY